MSSYWVYTDDGTLVIKEAPDHLSRKEIAHYQYLFNKDVIFEKIPYIYDICRPTISLSIT